MSNSYSDFASIYDVLTYDVDYDSYVDFLENIFEENNVKPKLILDLACGTGSVTHRLHQKGYDMIGIDSSDNMLDIARTKCESSDVLFLCQDMTEFELYGTVDAIVCALDSVNYINNECDLKKVFKLAHNYLNYDGLFVFDINSKYKLTEILGNNTFVDEHENIFYVWENETDGIETTFYLNFFVRNDDETYERIEEIHTERIYEEPVITDFLNQAGFSNVKTFDGFTFNNVHNESERITFVCKKINLKEE